jgi:MinD-like ATPase involved in chromosome partitioning or flagellar assembly
VAKLLFVVHGQRGRTLAAEAVRHGHAVIGHAQLGPQWPSALEKGEAEVAIVAGDPAVLSATALAECDARGVRIIGLVGTDEERRNAATLGLFEIVDSDASWPEIERLVLDPIGGSDSVGAGFSVGEVSSMGGDSSVGGPAGPAIGAAAPAPERGIVIAVWGPAGSPGRTTLAIGIAAELAANGHSVALGDVDTHAASIAPSLGLLDEAPGFAAACRLAGSNSLDRSELERIGQRYVSANGSFWVLTGLGRPSRWPELSAERVRGVITECRDWVEYTVLDTGFSLENDEEISSDLFAPRRNAATITALHEADFVIAVGAADPVGLSRFLRSHVDLAEVVTTSRVTVVANKVRAAAIGLNPTAQVEQTLSRFGGIDSPVLVPHDQAGADAAIISGRTLAEVAPRSPARLAIQQLVQSRILPAVPARTNSAWLSRLRVG